MSAVKSMLLHLDPSPRSAMRVAVARELATRHDATVTAMFAATPSALQAPHALGEGSSLFAAAAERLDEERRAQARAVFDATNPRPDMRWVDLKAAAPVPGFVREAFRHDLIVLGQHDPSDVDSHVVPADFAEAVIIDSGRPAIVVPYAGTFGAVGETVLIAWKPTRESARAVSAALPLLQRAKQVHVAGWDGEPRDLEHLFYHHGIDAVFHSEGQAPAHVGEYMLSRAAELGADLLVMGCYGHSRARELVLGGASRTVLESMTLPVLMVH